MAAPYSAVLFEVSGFTSTTPVPVDVPAGKVMVVRDIEIYTTATPGDAVFFMSIATGGTWFNGSSGIGIINWLQWQGRQVFRDAGFSVKVNGSAWDLRVCGYLLDA